MGICREKKMQPIWEFFYKNVIGQSGTARTLPSKREVGFTGVRFYGRGIFVVVIVNASLVIMELV